VSEPVLVTQELWQALNDDIVRLHAENAHLRDALRRIVACDYRGNMPPEQRIAKEALRDGPDGGS